MNVYDFLGDIERNEFSAYSLSEGALNPDTGYLAKVPGTEKFYGNLTPDNLRDYVTKNIGELFQPGRYILCKTANGSRLQVCIHLSYPSARELTEVNKEDAIYDCSSRRMEKI